MRKVGKSGEKLEKVEKNWGRVRKSEESGEKWQKVGKSREKLPISDPYGS